MFFFFFQAEDGIRDVAVTGVQTCALPIFVAQVSDSVQDLRNDGLANGDPAVMLILFRQPGANIIDTVDRVRSLLPHLRTAIPASIALNVYMDRTPTIRASLRDVERALVISVALRSEERRV